MRGRDGRRCGSPGTQVLRRRFAGENQIGVAVADSGHGLALEHARDMRNPLEVVARGCRVRSVVHGDEGGSGRRASPVCGAWAPRARQGLRHLVQRGQERLGCLPRAWVGLEHGTESSAWSSCGGAGTEFGAWPMEGSSGRPGSTDRVLVVLRSRTEGQGGPRFHGGEQLRRRSLLTCGGQGAIPAMTRSGVGERRPLCWFWARGGVISRLVVAREAVRRQKHSGTALCSVLRSGVAVAKVCVAAAGWR